MYRNIKLRELINRTKNKKEIEIFLQIQSLNIFITLLLATIIK